MWVSEVSCPHVFGASPRVTTHVLLYVIYDGALVLVRPSQ